MRLLALIAVLAAGVAPLSLAFESALDRWLSWAGLNASFTQYDYDANGILSRTSQGELTLQRPNLAVWQVRSPDPQSFYASARGVWHYDSWLEVATFHPIDEADSAATLALLSGDRRILEQRYNIAESHHHLLLTPRDIDNQIQSVRVTLTPGGYPTTLELETSLGHRSVIELSNTKPGEFSAEIFEFTPPPGTEIQ